MSSKGFGDRIDRFVSCSEHIREATLKSEHEFLKSAGKISTSQLEIILAIGRHGALTMSEIAKIMSFSKAGVTQMVDRLIARKYVKKTQRKDDRRKVEVKLLSKGQKIVDLNRAHIVRTARSWFGTISASQQEMLLNFWEKIIGKSNQNSKGAASLEAKKFT